MIETKISWTSYSYCVSHTKILWNFPINVLPSTRLCQYIAIITNAGPLHLIPLTHWSRVTHICVGNLIIIGLDNGLSPDRRQAIIWTNAGILLIGPLGTNFSEISIEILTFAFTKMRLKVSSAKRRPFCFGLNVLKPGPMFNSGRWPNTDKVSWRSQIRTNWRRGNH